MKVLILNNAYYEIASYLYQSARLKEEYEKLGVEVDVRKNNFFPAFIDGDIKLNVENYDFCVYLDKDKYISQILEKAGLKLFNSHNAVSVCDDKMSTYIALCGNQIAMPKTLSGPLCYINNATVAKETLDEVERKLGYPVIVKESFGSLGKGVYKAIKRQELEILAEKVRLKPHHFQQYISSSFGTDIRVIVIGGKVIASMKRISNGDFRSNIELGGHGEKCELDTAFKETAEKVARVLDLDYCGIDLLTGSHGEPIVCEVNSNAFFGGMEKVTGINIAKAFCEHTLSFKK